MKIESSYKKVTELEKGDTIVNLGIIKAIYPHRSSQRIQILFNPARDLVTHSNWYKESDKLMKA